MSKNVLIFSLFRMFTFLISYALSKPQSIANYGAQKFFGHLWSLFISSGGSWEIDSSSSSDGQWRRWWRKRRWKSGENVGGEIEWGWELYTGTSLVHLSLSFIIITDKLANMMENKWFDRSRFIISLQDYRDENTVLKCELRELQENTFTGEENKLQEKLKTTEVGIFSSSHF